MDASKQSRRPDDPHGWRAKAAVPVTGVLVTGAGGFIGRWVVAHLQARDLEVHGVDVSAPDDGDAYIPWHACDVRELDRIESIFAEVEPDTVVHLAGALGPETASRPFESHGINVQGTANVAEACSRTGVSRLLFSSSIAVYGAPTGNPAPVTEEDDCRPEILYGAQKLYCEHLIDAYRNAATLEGASIRVGTVFGHRRRTGYGRFHGQIVSLPAVGRPVSVPMWPKQPWSFIYVEDVAELVTLMVLSERLPKSVYNTGGENCTVERFAELVRTLIPDAEIELTGEAPTHASVHAVDGRRAERDFGFRRRSLREGIRAHVGEARRDAAAGPLPMTTLGES